nr:hypothetical protein [uncultured Marvinbryantia sp.]
MKSHIVIDGNAFYEVDEECLLRKQKGMEGTQATKGKQIKSKQKNTARMRRGGPRT